MQMLPALDHIFVGEPSTAAWVLERLRALLDVSAWEAETERARKAVRKQREARAVTRRSKNREAVRKRRRIARLIGEEASL